ncbi:ceramidase-domain-containing protein [Mycena sp. CBHHK59/15]|nr:ceramidase-domain-containing protein [Mycena sp. CBHHK59/15]
MAAMLNSSFVQLPFSYYIAEMANTFSNLFTIAFAIYGCFLSTREYLPSRYILGFLAQLADELPMIYVTSTTLWLLFDHKSGFNFESSRTRLLAVAMIAFDVLFTWSYYIYRNPVYHQVVFGTLLISIAMRIHYLLTRSSVGSRIPLEKKRAISKLFGLGVGQFIFAFLIWNLDNLYLALGWPIAFLLEGTLHCFLSPPGHSWWHVFTVRLILVEHTTNSWELNTCESIYALKHRLL